MTSKIAITNQKGGVGKTTIAINVAGALAARNHDVLLVDLDPQGHGTEGLGLQAKYESGSPNLHDVLLDLDDQDQINELIHQHEEFDVLPANIDLFAAESELTTAMRSRHRLQLALDSLNHDYDFILVDCPPSLGQLTDNALLACEHALVPALAESTSIRALELVHGQMATLEQNFDTSIKEIGIVANRVEPDGQSEEMMQWFDDNFDGIPVWEVRKRVALQRAWSAGVSIHQHSEDCDMEAVFESIATRLEEVAA